MRHSVCTVNFKLDNPFGPKVIVKQADLDATDHLRASLIELPAIDLQILILI